MLAIKICTHDRVRRIAVIVNKTSDTLIPDIISAANKTFEIDGDSLILEEDGIFIDNGLLIIQWKDKLFMLLKKNQYWSPTNQASKSNCSSIENETPNVNTECSRNKRTELGNNYII